MKIKRFCAFLMLLLSIESSLSAISLITLEALGGGLIVVGGICLFGTFVNVLQAYNNNQSELPQSIENPPSTGLATFFYTTLHKQAIIAGRASSRIIAVLSLTSFVAIVSGSFCLLYSNAMEH